MHKKWTEFGAYVVTSPREQSVKNAGLRVSRPDKVLTADGEVRGDNCLFPDTGVADGEMPKGVRYFAGGAVTQRLEVHPHSGTVRMIEAYHRPDKLNRISIIDYA